MLPTGSVTFDLHDESKRGESKAWKILRWLVDFCCSNVEVKATRTYINDLRNEFRDLLEPKS